MFIYLSNGQEARKLVQIMYCGEWCNNYITQISSSNTKVSDLTRLTRRWSGVWVLDLAQTVVGWKYLTGIPAGIPAGYPPGIPAGIPAVPPFFGQPPSGLLTGYPAGIIDSSGIPVGSIENILVNI